MVGKKGSDREKAVSEQESREKPSTARKIIVCGQAGGVVDRNLQDGTLLPGDAEV